MQGVDSDTEITPDTLPHNIKVAKIKVRVLSDILRQHPSYLSPYWWCESYIYGYPDIHRVNVKDDETVESIDTVNVDQYIEEPKVSIPTMQLHTVEPYAHISFVVAETMEKVIGRPGELC